MKPRMSLKLASYSRGAVLWPNELQIGLRGTAATLFLLRVSVPSNKMASVRSENVVQAESKIATQKESYILEL
jgi:hypothetical protein